jgi:hypothetical protein
VASTTATKKAGLLVCKQAVAAAVVAAVAAEVAVTVTVALVLITAFTQL